MRLAFNKAIKADRLMEELLARKPEWRGRQVGSGQYENSPLRIFWKGEHVEIEFPDDPAADARAVVESVVAAHDPTQPTASEAREAQRDNARLLLIAWANTQPPRLMNHAEQLALLRYLRAI